MSDLLIKPYELSIWDSELTQQEQKIAIIGSDSLKAPNMAYDIVFHKNKNGEKTLTFSMRYKYFDHNTGKVEENPFVPYLINERKVKLYYEDEWYDFIIKEIEENSEEYAWTYTAQDAFVLELSKNGYNITFSNELNNNLGTAQQLAERTLENTDWEVIDLDVGEPIINEPTYKAKTLTNLSVKRMDDDTDETIPANTDILVFYSYIANKNGKFLQFIKAEADESKYDIDSHSNITALNYRFNFDVVFKTITDSNGNVLHYYIDDLNGTHLIEYAYIYKNHEVYRTIYQQLVCHDPVMDRIVDEYEYEEDYTRIKVYHYTDSVYTTSNVITSFITNGEHFNTYEDGSLQGWNTYTDGGHASIELSTYPNIDPLNPIVDINTIKRLEGYLQVKFRDGSGYSPIFNTGIQNNHYLIQRITKGDKFVFRYRAGKSSVEHGQPLKLTGNELEVKVAFYEEVEQTIDNVKRFVNKPTTTILHFYPTASAPARILNNVITGGSINSGHTSYTLNGVEQEPSSKTLYNDTISNINYYWNDSQYSVYNSNANFLNYFYLVASAVTNITPEQLQDPNVKIGIFIYPTNSNDNNYYYLNDVQLTRYYPSEIPVVTNSEEMYPLTIGNIPTAQVLSTDYFYLAPEPTDDKNKITLYLTLNELETAMGWPLNSIKPIYNRGTIIFIDTNEDIYRVRKELLRRIYEQFHVKGYALNKVSSIEASRSNCFNILQTIAENFECWIDLYVEHNEDGSIFIDDEGNTLKTVFLRRYSGKENFAGFKYGINLNNITRTVDSNEIVTKLIVENTQTDLVDSGVISIEGAQSNFNKEAYIFNFDYYLNHDLLPRIAFNDDLNDFNFNMNRLNTALQQLQTLEREKSNALIKINSNRNVYNELLTSARKSLNEALDDFKALTAYTYSEYQTKSETEKSDLLKIDKVKDTIGKIYNCYAIDNSYRGLYANIDTEYNSIYRELYGMKDHYIKISCIPGSPNLVHIELDDYIIPFSFKLQSNSYQTSLSQKSFDIEVANFNNLTISNINYNTDKATGYLLQSSQGQTVSSITINSNIVQTYVLKAKTPSEGIKTQIDNIIEEKKTLIKAFSIRYSRFILEGTWSSQEYLSDELYYLDALLAGKVAAFPKVTYNINVADVSGIKGYEGYSFNIGDRTYIEDTEFFGWIYKGDIKTPAKEEIIISELERHLDDPSQNSITVQNYKDHFEDLFQRLQATVQTVDYNEVTYPKTSSILDSQKKINQELLLASLSQVAGLQRPLTTDGSIVIDGDSITITNLLKPTNVVRVSSEGITISSDGGKTWSTAITGEGINIGNVISDFINTKKIWIGNKDNPSYRWDSNGLSAFKLLSNEKYDFKQFVRFDQYGLYGIDLNSTLNHRSNYDYVATSLNDIKQDANFAITWDGFFIKNKYPGGGRVEITSDNDFRVLNTVNGNEREKIKIGALEWTDGSGNITTNPSQGVGAPVLYGLRIQNNTGQTVMQTGDDGNLSITNTMRVGVINGTEPKTHIVIDGEHANIHSSNFQTGASYGWMINSDGDAYFNNITARGAIRTAVFEYAEIQAVGGIFIFRPSSTIKKAKIASNGTDLIVTVEKPLLFTNVVYKTTEDTTVQSSKTYYKKVDYGYEKITNPSGNPHAQDYYESLEKNNGNWCKISNYTSDSSGQAQIKNILLTNGLTHVYKISNINTSNGEITLQNGNEFITALAHTPEEKEKLLDELKGGALIDMGREDRTANYGIGVNSSDNSVNLPPRSISLFETVIDKNKSVKVTYEYKGILGTLPWLRYEGSSAGEALVAPLYNDYLKDTQGIYTNNMYIGDKDQYIAFYTDKSSSKHLSIVAKEFKLIANRPGQDKFLYLSNTDYGESTTINGHTNTQWRLIIGDKFGILKDGTVYASNGHFSGEITATSGKVGNWIVENPTNNTYGGALYTGTFNRENGVFLTPKYTTTTNIGGSIGNGNKNWTIVAGTKFGVTTAGDLYASNANISGAITANTGYIGGLSGWIIESQHLYSGEIGKNNSIHLGTKKLTSNDKIGGRSENGSDWQLTIGSGFGVTNNGVIYASGAQISGVLKAGANSTIGPWTVTSGSIQTGAYNSSGKMYFGSDGLSIGTTFRVDSNGKLTATGADIGGVLNAGANSTIGPWTVTNNSIQTGNYNTSGTMYFGTSGLSIGTAFVVNSGGKLIATGADITGAIKAQSFIAYDLYNSTYRKRVVVDVGGLKVLDTDETSILAQFGSQMHIGKLNANHVAITSTGLNIYSDNNTDEVSIGNGVISFTKNNTNIGSFRYSYYKPDNNLYGLVIDLNRAITTVKPAFAGITADDSAGNNYFKLIYLQDNASIEGYTSGALNAGCSLDMNRFNIQDVNNIYTNKVYLGDTTRHISFNTFGDISFSERLYGYIHYFGRGCQWYQGRDNATFTTYTLDGYSPCISLKTTTGSWEMGAYDSSNYEDELIFTFIKDYNYNNQINTANGRVRFRDDGSIEAEDGIFNGSVIASTGLTVSGGADISGGLTVSGADVNFTGLSTSTLEPNLRLRHKQTELDAPVNRVVRGVDSSKKIKFDISDLQDLQLQAQNLYKAQVRQFKYNLDYLDETDMRYNVNIPGFIAEELYEVYPIAVDLDENNQPRNWNVRYIVPPMLKLIQEQHAEIEQLKKDIAELKNK